MVVSLYVVCKYTFPVPCIVTYDEHRIRTRVPQFSKLLPPLARPLRPFHAPIFDFLVFLGANAKTQTFTQGPCLHVAGLEPTYDDWKSPILPVKLYML